MNEFENITAVSDSSFIIGVTVSGQWQTLKALVKTLFVVDAVWEEIVVQDKGKPCQKEIENASFVERKSVTNRTYAVFLKSH